MSKQLVETIKTRGSWRVRFLPRQFEPARIPSLPKCEEFVEKASVSLRGWSYPHVPRRTGTTIGNDYIEGATDSGAFKELWRLYQSAQFIHLVSVREDWMKEDPWFANRQYEPGAVLSVVNAVYSVTEMFQFLSRLAQFGIYKEGVDISVSLHNTEGRRLEIFDPMRAPLLDEYRSRIPDIIFERTLPEAIAFENPNATALTATLHLFHRFNWKNPPVDVIKADQQRLLELRR